MSEVGADDPAGTGSAPPGASDTAASAEAPVRRSLLQRVIGALRLDPTSYDEVAADPAALAQAAIVAALAAAARAVDFTATAPTSIALTGAIYVFAFWPVGGLLLWAIGNWFGHPVRLAAALRVIGFAMAPLLLMVLAVAPWEWLRDVVRLVVTALFLGALVVAIREVLRVTIGRAAFVGFVVMMIVVFLSLIGVYVQLHLHGLA